MSTLGTAVTIPQAMSSSTTSSVKLAAVSAACMPKLRVPASFRATYCTMLPCDSSVGLLGFIAEAAHPAPVQK
jgi:hypothetical protein